MKLSIKCKLLINNPKEHQELKDVMISFNRACTWVSGQAFNTQTFSQVKLHKLVYYEVKQRFNMSSQLAVRVIGKVVDSYKNKKQRISALEFREMGTIDYDTRNLTIKPDTTLSIMVLGKRIKVPYRCKKPLKEYDLCCQSELAYDKIKDRFYVNFFADISEQPSIQTDKYLGVDLGIVNLATTSDGQKFSGDKIEAYRTRITSLKARLQSKGTKSAKRHLKKISRKESFHKKDINHCISKKLVEKAKALGMGIKLEDLTHIHTKKTVIRFTKEQRDNNAKRSKWAFFQLRQFITYKAKIAGIPILCVNPAYTSQTCSSCGHCHDDNRLSQSDFKCIKCGFALNADYNAAINISRASINKPIVSEDEIQTNKSLLIY